MIHGALERTTKWEYPLDEKNLSAEMLLLWARHAMMSVERPEMMKHMESLKADPDSEPEELEYYEKMWESGEADLAFLQGRFLEV